MPAVPRLYFDNCFSKDSTPHFDGNRFSRGLGYCTTALEFNSTFLVSLNPEEMEERICYSLASLKLAIRIVVSDHWKSRLICFKKEKKWASLVSQW